MKGEGLLSPGLYNRRGVQFYVDISFVVLYLEGLGDIPEQISRHSLFSNALVKIQVFYLT